MMIRLDSSKHVNIKRQMGKVRQSRELLSMVKVTTDNYEQWTSKYRDVYPVYHNSLK